MKVSGFTMVRNAIKYDYPVVESITSILPCVDEMVVAVGQSEDETLQLIQHISSPKIKIIETLWDDSLREGGKVLAVETDKAFQACSPDSDWCFYIQADEVVHEKYHDQIRKAMHANLSNTEVEGLLFGYQHFYGSYDYIGDSRSWYRNEIRIVRNDPSIHSYKDAQGFRKSDRKMKVKQTGAKIFHYGWVRNPVHLQDKVNSFHKLWHEDDWLKNNVAEADAFDYNTIDSVVPFTGTHPEVMKERLRRMNWTFDFDPSKKKLSTRDTILLWIEKLTGYRFFEYRNYRIIG